MTRLCEPGRCCPFQLSEGRPARCRPALPDAARRSPLLSDLPCGAEGFRNMWSGWSGSSVPVKCPLEAAEGTMAEGVRRGFILST